MRAPSAKLWKMPRSYRWLSLRDVFLSFAGYRPAQHRVHRAIAELASGDRLRVRAGAKRWGLLDGNGTVVGQLAGGFEPPQGMRSASVLAVATWSRDRSDPEYQEGLRCDEWEVVVPELVFEPS